MATCRSSRVWRIAAHSAMARPSVSVGSGCADIADVVVVRQALEEHVGDGVGSSSWRCSLAGE